MSLGEYRVQREQQELQRLSEVALLQREADWRRGIPALATPEQLEAMDREKKRRGMGGPVFRSAKFGATEFAEGGLGPLGPILSFLLNLPVLGTLLGIMAPAPLRILMLINWFAAKAMKRNASRADGEV